jgi:hypothetical protein
MNSIGKAIKWTAILFMICIIANFVLILVDEYPLTSYEKSERLYPFASDCSAVHPGQDLQSTLNILTRHSEPLRQRMDGTKLLVLRGHVECIVEFDVSTSRVTKVESHALPYFDKRNI